MSEIVQEFYDFFGLSDLFSAETVTVLDFLRGSVTVFVGVVFVLVMLRFVMEIVKIVTDWRRFL